MSHIRTAYEVSASYKASHFLWLDSRFRLDTRGSRILFRSKLRSLFKCAHNSFTRVTWLIHVKGVAWVDVTNFAGWMRAAVEYCSAVIWGFQRPYEGNSTVCLYPAYSVGYTKKSSSNNAYTAHVCVCVWVCVCVCMCVSVCMCVCMTLLGTNTEKSSKSNVYTVNVCVCVFQCFSVYVCEYPSWVTPLEHCVHVHYRIICIRCTLHRQNIYDCRIMRALDNAYTVLNTALESYVSDVIYPM